VRCRFDHASSVRGIGSQAGISVLQLVVGVAISGAVLTIGYKVLEKVGALGKGLSADGSFSEVLNTLRSDIRERYVFRTQLEIGTGSGVYIGVVFDPVAAPNRLEIRTRDRIDTSKVKVTRYETTCVAAKGGRPAPVLPASFCAYPPPTCAVNQRLAVVASTWNDQNAMTGAPAKRRIYPATGTKGSGSVSGVALCIGSADNDRVSLKIGIEMPRPGRKYRWRVEVFELWDDIGLHTVEFLSR
jgi:hypothetical protein